MKFLRYTVEALHGILKLLGSVSFVLITIIPLTEIIKVLRETSDNLHTFVIYALVIGWLYLIIRVVFLINSKESLYDLIVIKYKSLKNSSNKTTQKEDKK
jgi:ABC-type arginine transport system permease subunit